MPDWGSRRSSHGLRGCRLGASGSRPAFSHRRRRVEDAGALQESRQRPARLVESDVRRPSPSDHDDVEPRAQVGFAGSQRLAYQTLGAVPSHRVADLARRRQPVSRRSVERSDPIGCRQDVDDVHAVPHLAAAVVCAPELPALLECLDVQSPNARRSPSSTRPPGVRGGSIVRPVETPHPASQVEVAAPILVERVHCSPEVEPRL